MFIVEWKQSLKECIVKSIALLLQKKLITTVLSLLFQCQVTGYSLTAFNFVQPFF